MNTLLAILPVLLIIYLFIKLFGGHGPSLNFTWGFSLIGQLINGILKALASIVTTLAEAIGMIKRKP